MYSLATILLIGFAAALTPKKNETVNMAQVNATYEAKDCEDHCWANWDLWYIQCDYDDSQNTEYCQRECDFYTDDKEEFFWF